MSNTNKRPLAVFLLAKYRKIGDFIFKVKTIVQDIGNNVAIFATPSPTLASVTTHIGALETAETVAATKIVGSAAARDIKYGIVLDDVHTLQNYVQNIADAASDEATAISIIQASGFSLKVNGVHAKALMAAKNGKVSGTVILTAKAAGKRASYNWQQSANNGTTWVDLPPTLASKTTVSGLSAGARLVFRSRPITKDGPGDWSDPASCVVQ